MAVTTVNDTATYTDGVGNKSEARGVVLMGGTPPIAQGATTGNAQGTRAYDFANNVRSNVGASSSAAIQLPPIGASREVMVHASTRCFVRFGALPALTSSPAQAEQGHLIPEAGERFHMQIPSEITHFRVIRDTTDGFITITAVL